MPEFHPIPKNNKEDDHEQQEFFCIIFITNLGKVQLTYCMINVYKCIHYIKLYYNVWTIINKITVLIIDLHNPWLQCAYNRNTTIHI